MTVREKFVEIFGEEQCVAIEVAAESHANGVNSARKGSDEFRWALCICIGHECMSKDCYRESHGINADWDALRSAIKWYGHLDKHDGDLDYLALFSGMYQEFMPGKAVQA